MCTLGMAVSDTCVLDLSLTELTICIPLARSLDAWSGWK